MKLFTKIVLPVLALAFALPAYAAKPLAGPKGGKIVTAAAPHVEFFVTPQRNVVVSFYDKDLKPVAASGQVVSAVAEAKSGKATLAFAAKDGALVSTTPLPAGDGYRVVLQVRENANAKQQNYRVEFHGEVCEKCKRAEYACTCEDAGKHDGHKH